MRIIVHIDMDAFFAAVEECDNPQFRGLPIAVGAEPSLGRGRGVVSTANYLARAYGIHSALPISRAWRLSEAARQAGKPAVIFLPVNFRRYGEVSRRIFEIVGKFTPILEQTSIDEAYLDLSFTGAYEKAVGLCREIKDTISDEWGLTASIGVGPNKLIAKIASDFKKPDGLTLVREDEAAAFLEPLPIRKIPGIGPKTEAMFARKDAKTVRDLKKYSLDELRGMLGKPPHPARIEHIAQSSKHLFERQVEHNNKFAAHLIGSKIRVGCGGKWGGELYQKIRGIDDSPLVWEREAKSIGEQETFLRDTLEPILLFERLKFLCQSVFARFGESGLKSFRAIAITVRFADFKTKSRAHTLAEPADTLAALEREAMKLLLPFFDGRENPEGKLIRLLGARIESLK